MDQEIKAEWCSRLTDGKRKQGSAYLKRGDEYCCLGVLSEMAAEAGVVTVVPYSDLTAFFDEAAGTHWTSLLPPAVAKWAGLPDETIGPNVVTSDGSRENLTGLNDKGVPFVEIAKYIQEQL